MVKYLRFKSENYYLDPLLNKRLLFPRVDVESSVCLSVIVPAYNEELRLPKMLDEALDYLETRAKASVLKDVGGKRNPVPFTYEVIVVDDGSTDSTSKVALEYSKRYSTNKVRVLTLQKNRGKGGAIRLGILSSRGKYALFADADGATTFQDYGKVENSMLALTGGDDTALAIVVGSRAHLEQQSIAQRSAFRTLLMWCFHLFVWLFCVRSIRDTQCGFKLFTRATVRLLFPIMHVERWAFDVELLFLAEKLNVPMNEVAVQWTEVDGSKIVPVLSWLQMGRDIILIWLWYCLGLWSLDNDKAEMLTKKDE